MRQWLFILAVASAVICQAGSLYASCPGDDDLTYIFCDDFDSYCTTGGPPGTPNCPGGSSKDNSKLQAVWFPLLDTGCFGTTMIVQDATASIISNVYSGRYASAVYLGQESVRDWIASAEQSTDVLNIQRRINKVHGGASNAVNGTADAPLIMSFQMAANLEKLFYSGGYMELALGEHADPLNRANTDYVNQTANCCNEANRPFPVICAQGNPDSALPAGCPVVGTTPPPVHQAVAVGAFVSLDNNPCDGCNPSPPATPTQYRQNNRHLALFDGKVWWTLNGTTLPPGASVSGSLVDGAGNPVSPPAGYFPWLPGDFYLVSTLTTTTPAYKTANSQCYNNVELKVYATTMTVKLTSRVRTNDGLSLYWVTSTMENIPRQYAGSFDRIRAGVGPGCALASNTDWSACATIDGRVCLTNSTGLGVEFDNFLLHGGVGVTLPGACCKADGTCAQMAKADCEALDLNGNPVGHFVAVGQACNESVSCCPLVYGDTDQDGDVDMVDFAKLQTCLTLGGGSVSDDCSCLDSDGANGINSDDVLKFVQCANGPGIPANAGASCRGPGW